LPGVRFIFIPNLHDVLHGYAIDPFEDVGPRRQNGPGTATAMLNVTMVFLSHWSALAPGTSAAQNSAATQRKYNSSYSFHDTSRLVG